MILTRDQLREEIQAAITAALNSSGNQSPSPLNFHRNDSCSCYGLNATLQEAVGRLQQEVRSLRHPGRSTCYPATSCRQIKEDDPNSPSGYYYIQSGSRSFVRAYCDMSRSCGGITGGWMRVAKLDMRNVSDSCPNGLKTLTQPKRLCAMNIGGGGCSSTSFSVHDVQYTRVCGKIIGYQQKTPDAFWPY